MIGISKLSVKRASHHLRETIYTRQHRAQLPLYTLRQGHFYRFHSTNNRITVPTGSINPKSSNPPLSFPCLDQVEKRSAELIDQSTRGGPEPSYNTSGPHEKFKYTEEFIFDWGGKILEFELAYETWGKLNANKSNAILLHTGLSASSHAHSNDSNPRPGWWEDFIGPNKPLDTTRYHIICTNVLGGCYGSSGPSSIDPANGQRYATRFPILTIEDMVRAQFKLLDYLNIHTLYASVGSSMGGMLSLASGVLFPDRVNRIVSISGCAKCHPYSIALRYIQRQALMMDPAWSRGFYYDEYGGIPPHAGMKLAREIATVTYRSGPEWEQRFGRKRANPNSDPALCADFCVENYIDHAGEKWCLNYDANSYLYISKAMDLFDLSESYQRFMAKRRVKSPNLQHVFEPSYDLVSKNHITSSAIKKESSNTQDSLPIMNKDSFSQTNWKANEDHNFNISLDSSIQTAPTDLHDLAMGLKNLRDKEILIMGVASDILFPAVQQREIYEATKLMLKMYKMNDKQGSHEEVSQEGLRRRYDSIQYVELSDDQGLFGHDTFLLDVKNIGGEVGRFFR